MARKPLLHLAANDRLGVVPGAVMIPTSLADVPGVFHASVRSPFGPSGGVGWSADEAKTAAIGEALERYAAATHALPAFNPPEGIECYKPNRFTLFSETQLDGLPMSRAQCQRNMVPVFVAGKRLHDEAVVAVPRALVSLSDPDGEGVVTSNGLAAGPSLELATLRGLQEVIERDALMVAWLHGISCPTLELPLYLSERLAGLGADVIAVDLTPEYSPWPVVAVCGSVAWRGRARVGMGAACRATSEAALEKAFLEWTQATVFVGVQMSMGTMRTYDDAAAVVAFDDHALYYSARPDEWARVPFTKRRPVSASDRILEVSDNAGTPVSSRAGFTRGEEGEMGLAVDHLRAAGLDTLVVDLTTDELSSVGVRAVRVLVPGLVPVNSDHKWPFLGGTASDWAFRFPKLSPSVAFPSPFPHPLG